ncbi:hypothetical protein MMC25_006663 [Agyrium rufum]|nr:hypothetical protein [Agyrium rufum]
MSNESERPLKPIIYRIEQIPSNLDIDEFKQAYILPGDREFVKIKSWSPSVDSPEGEERTATATVCYSAPTRQKLHIASDEIIVDEDFYGFTPLYTPSKEKGPIAIDVIAIAGLAGHAYGSWAHSPERMWLRDYLPHDAPNARIMTYGYKCLLEGSKAPSKLSDFTSKFLNRLLNMREIGKVILSLTVKALVNIPFMGLRTHRLPVRAIIFLAAPHQGIELATLAALVKGQPTEALVAELRPGSTTLEYLRDNFRHVSEDIEILSCYETEPTKSTIEVDGNWKLEGPEVMMVSSDSARQFSANEKWELVDANHSQIAKVTKGESGIYLSLLSAIRSALTPNTHARTWAQEHERTYYQVSSLSAVPYHVAAGSSTRPVSNANRDWSQGRMVSSEQTMEEFQRQSSNTQDTPNQGFLVSLKSDQAKSLTPPK